MTTIRSASLPGATVPIRSFRDQGRSRRSIVADPDRFLRPEPFLDQQARPRAGRRNRGSPRRCRSGPVRPSSTRRPATNSRSSAMSCWPRAVARRPCRFRSGGRPLVRVACIKVRLARLGGQHWPSCLAESGEWPGTLCSNTGRVEVIATWRAIEILDQRLAPPVRFQPSSRRKSRAAGGGAGRRQGVLPGSSCVLTQKPCSRLSIPKAAAASG